MYSFSITNFSKSVDSTPKEIQARISTVSTFEDNYVRLEADSVKFDNSNVDSKILIYVYDNNGLYENIKVGEIIKFKPSTFYHTDLFYRDTPDARAYARNLKYSTSVSYNNIQFIGQKMTFAEIFKARIKSSLTFGLTNENAEIAYSALFGDKEYLPNEQYNTFKLSGVAHLLAVSGLHVGILVVVLKKILQLLKIKKWWQFGIIAFVLFGYIYICNFTISIIRASIMSLVLLFSNLIHADYDSFNSIAIAGIVIYLINPLCIFDVSFLLSFSCVLGIAMLFKPIKRVLAFLKFSNVIIDNLAISISTTLSIIIIMAYYFNTLNVISIIANIILIPLFTIAFSCVILVSFISVLLQQVAYVLYPVNYIFDIIKLFSNIFAGLTFSNFNTISFNYIAIVIYFALLLILGRLCTAKNQYKVVTTLPIVALLFCVLV